MTEATQQHGAFSWNELMTSDVAGAKTFYSALLGWDMEEHTMNMPYTIAKLGEQQIGGIMAIPADAGKMPPMWGAYVTVDDVDAMVAQVESLGGNIIMPPTDIPDIGRFCVIQDPQGAVLSLITYSCPSTS
jgi:predicted enzyme related to lactoylglutathione lyase